MSIQFTDKANGTPEQNAEIVSELERMRAAGLPIESAVAISKEHGFNDTIKEFAPDVLFMAKVDGNALAMAMVPMSAQVNDSADLNRFIGMTINHRDVVESLEAADRTLSVLMNVANALRDRMDHEDILLDMAKGLRGEPMVGEKQGVKH